MFITIFEPWKRDLRVTSLFFPSFYTLSVLMLFGKNKNKGRMVAWIAKFIQTVSKGMR